MKKFTVQYAGVTRSKRVIYASGAKKAAFEYFRKEMYRNTIFVSSGIKEQTFSWQDFAHRIPDFDESRLIRLRPPPEPTKPRSLWSEFLNNLIKGEFRTWDWKDKRK